jgi:hypothetical protein
MAGEPTLQALYGANASQTSSQLTIAKGDLTGLTASSTNTAESLLVALLLKWESELTTANQASNSDQSITVVRGTPTLTTEFDATTGNSTQYKETPFTLTLRKPYVDSGIDPDDY